MGIGFEALEKPDITVVRDAPSYIRCVCGASALCIPTVYPNCCDLLVGGPFVIKQVSGRKQTGSL